MIHYEVLTSDKALADMESIYDYIAGTFNAPETADRQYDRIANAILSLEEMPERVEIMDSEPEHTKGLRALRVDYNELPMNKEGKIYAEMLGCC